MSETILGGLVLAGISALCFLAYQHPNQFKKLALYLGGLLFLVWWSVGVWFVAVSRTQTFAIKFMDGDEWVAFEKLSDTILPDIWLIAFGPSVTLLFLLVLFHWVTTLKATNVVDEAKRNESEF